MTNTECGDGRGGCVHSQGLWGGMDNGLQTKVRGGRDGHKIVVSGGVATQSGECVERMDGHRVCREDGWPQSV